MKIIWIALAAMSFSIGALAQPYQPNWKSLNTRGIPAWFSQAKFGIFIHWGVYSVPSYAPVIPNSGYSYAEWYWYRLKEGNPYFKAFHDKNYGASFRYPQFEKQFTADMFDPAAWADLFKKSGAKYVVLTSKHHEGYCLWNSPQADRDWKRPWNAVTGTPHRDLLGDLTRAVRAEGIKMGYYYSLYEWFNPLWLTDTAKYVNDHMIPQLKDLVTKYHPSLIFADGEWALPDLGWHSPELLAWMFNDTANNKDLVVDDRWGSNTRDKNHGCTYSTSEYGSGMEPGVVWEENRGIGHSYGYNRNEKVTDYKSSHDLTLLLVDVVSRGGNLLLDIGPTADGRIPVIMQERLLDIGKWLSTNGEAIYGTTPYSHPHQWSEGPLPTESHKSFMANYDAAKLVQGKPGVAHLEYFFTTKGHDLYIIVPNFNPSILIKGLQVRLGTRAILLGSKMTFPCKNAGKNCLIDLSSVHPGQVPAQLFVLKLKGGI
ncbi:MAG: alpha-L-fucosidase [Bacteroidota bacterium]|nr:alpha-L-fucosidase [Bacteroidota bacterium]